jgi:1,4-dihydroxy-2-naphthoyl-CoA hydrolase
VGFTIQHTVRFHETDAAGVLYFANGLTICHSAYEASLAAVGIDLATFFSSGELAYPVVQATIDYWRPMRCGDKLKVWLHPRRLDEATFEVQSQIFLHHQPDKPLARSLTRHVCITTQNRQKHPLPTEMEAWIQQWGDLASK